MLSIILLLKVISIVISC